jgi:MoaA/NifB/PqqE/SkfB family radical SAM enzyme
MRAIAIDANEHGGLGSPLDEMHQLHARVFAGRLGWQVKIEYGRERDEYDALDPTYILALTDRGEVAGCVPACFRPRARPCWRRPSRSCLRAAGYGASPPRLRARAFASTPEARGEAGSCMRRCCRCVRDSERLP